MKLVAKILLGLLLALALLVGAGYVYLGFGDGPYGPIRGGALVSGELVTEPNVDWNAVFADGIGDLQFELKNGGDSRQAGGFVHEGDLYIPCDLGFIWRRVPDAQSRAILGTIWFFKDWHERAVEDGRTVIRVGDKRYERNLVRVEDEALEAQFRARLEVAAAEYMGGMMPGAGDPEQIWFFKVI